MSSLFQNRRKLERSNNIKLFVSIVDWTVALYIVVPSIIIGFFLYKDFAIHVETLWVAKIPLTMYIITLFFVTRIETIRTYLQRADRLFLIQNSKKMIQLKQAGLYWTLGKHLSLLIIVLALLSPIFIKVHHLSILGLLSFLMLLFTANFCNALLQLRLQQKWLQLLSKFVVWFIGITLFLYAPNMVTALICIIVFLFSILYYKRHFVLSMKHFDQQVELDQAAFYKWQSVIFQITPELKSLLIPKMKKPMLFLRNSKRIFSRSEFFIEELVCKTMLRQKQYRWGYLRLLLMGIWLIVIVPLWAKFVLLVILYFALRTYMQSVIQYTFEHKIWTIFQVSKDQIQQACTRLVKGFVDFPVLCVLIMIIIYIL